MNNKMWIIFVVFLSFITLVSAHNGGHTGCFLFGCPFGHSFGNPDPNYICPWTDPPCTTSSSSYCDVLSSTTLSSGPYYTIDVCAGGLTLNCNGASALIDMESVGGNTITQCNGNIQLKNSNLNVLLDNMGYIGLKQSGTNTLDSNKAIIFLNESSNDNTIINNNATGYTASSGIQLINSHNNDLMDNIANGNLLGIGIGLSNYNTVQNNIVSQNRAHGFFISSSSNNILTQNTVTQNSFNTSIGYGDAGIVLIYSDSNVLSSNTINGNDGYGVYVVGSNLNNIQSNIINSNNCGVGLAGYASTSPANSNTVSGNTMSSNNICGIYLSGSHFNTLSSNIITLTQSTGGMGILFSFEPSNSNIISANTVNSNPNGIFIRGDYNNIQNNIVNQNTNNGINIFNGNFTTVTGNTVIGNNRAGIIITNSKYSTLTGNTMADNTRNFNIGGGEDSHFDHSIDTTNTVQSKPIYYIKDALNQIYGASTNAGFFACIDCNNIEVKDLVLTNNSHGVLFRNTHNSLIHDITASKNSLGIGIAKSNSNNINSNTVSLNFAGINLNDADSNTLNLNNVSMNGDTGILLSNSDSNTLSNNIVNKNIRHLFGNIFLGKGIDLSFSNNNILDSNVANENREFGIRLSSSNYNTVKSNMIRNHTKSGINIVSSNSNLINHNVGELNAEGILFFNSFGNQLLNNTFYNNTIGFKMTSSHVNFANDNKVCFNSVSDFNLSNSLSNSGIDNKCDKPDGWNDVNAQGCTSRCTPLPILLIHGIYSSDSLWDQVENALQAEGFTAYRVGEAQNSQLNSNAPGLVPNNGDIVLLSGQVRNAIQNIKTYTGRNKVNVVTHSLGGLATRQHIKDPNYMNDIDKLITLGTPNEGAPIAQTEIAFLFGVTLGATGSNTIVADTARYQMIPGSSFLQALNNNFDTYGIEHSEIAGTSLPQSLSLFLLLCSIQPSYCALNSVTDSIVPRSSVNIPNINCYQRHVVHQDQFGVAYYEDNGTINNIIRILKGEPVNLQSCPSEDERSFNEPSNNMQLLVFNNLINPGETQVIASNIDVGNRFLTILNWSGGELNLEFITPSGNIINSNNSNNFNNVSFFNQTSGTSQQLFIFNAPESGNWTVQVSASNLNATTYYNGIILMEKNVSIRILTNKTIYTPNEPLVINVELLDDYLPVLNANVSSSIIKPDSTSSQLVLYDDGAHNDTNANDGIYGNIFLDTNLEGAYVIDADAFILNIFQIKDRAVVFVELIPDLEIAESDIIFDPPLLILGQNQTINISATIRNIGNKDAQNVSVRFYNGHPAFGGIFASQIINVLANSSYTVTSQLNYVFNSYPYVVVQGSPNVGSTINISITDPAFENYDVYVTMSSSNLTESNYSNNIAHKNLSFQDTYYVLAISLGTSPGILLPDNRTIPLNFDGAFILSVFYSNLIGLQNSAGILDNNGQATATWTIPSYAIPGITVYLGFVTINPLLAMPQAVLSISPAIPVTILP